MQRLNALVHQRQHRHAIQSAAPAAVAQSIAFSFAAYDSSRDGWLIEQREALTRRADFAEYAAANARSVAGMLDGPIYDRLGALQMPALVLFGAGDRLVPNRFVHQDMTPQDIAKAARRAMPRARVELMPQDGHLLMQEQADLFNQRVAAFLEK